jgi:hypothetical protein
MYDSVKNGLRGIAEVKHIAQVMREHPRKKSEEDI